MNEALTPIQKIDSVLNFMLNDANDPAFVTFSEILDSIQLKFKCNQKELTEILHTLEIDGRIFTEESNGVKLYKSTFDGRLFAADGGYQGKINRQNAENTRLAKLEQSQKDYQIWMTWLTAILAVGTTIAALYYCVDLYWHHGWFHF